MSGSEPRNKADRPRRRRWLLICVLGLLILVLPFAALYFHARWGAERELQEAIAELDRSDPGWRLEDIEAKRRTVAAEENAALVVAAAHRLRPAKWNYEILNELELVPPPCLLTAHQEKALRAEVEPFRKTIEAARKLIDLPSGRHPLVYAPNYLDTLLNAQQNTRDIATALHLDAVLLAQEAKTAAALSSARAILNAARSLGDEPLIISALIRIALQGVALASVERILAQGNVPEAQLADMQKALEQEIGESLLLRAVRGERAGMHMLFSNIESGKLTFQQAMGKKADLRGALEELTLGNRLRRSHAWMLRHLSQVVEAAKLTGPAQIEALQKIRDEVARLDADRAKSKELAIGLLLVMPSWPGMARAELRSDARLACLTTALAAERFRLKNGVWPTSLQELVQAKLLEEIPKDPYDGQPLRLRPTNDGLVIYSVGLEKNYAGDALDDLTRFGELEIQIPGGIAIRYEVRLWNPERRRQPPLATQKPGFLEKPGF